MLKNNGLNLRFIAKLVWSAITSIKSEKFFLRNELHAATPATLFWRDSGKEEQDAAIMRYFKSSRQGLQAISLFYIAATSLSHATVIWYFSIGLGYFVNCTFPF